MATVDVSVHMGDDLTTAGCSLSDVCRLGGNKDRIIAFVNVGYASLFFESLAQIDEVSAVLIEARRRFEEVLATEPSNA